jgi:hypothetical protein
VTSQGQTLEEAQANIKEAIYLYIESFGIEDRPIRHPHRWRLRLKLPMPELPIYTHTNSTHISKNIISFPTTNGEISDFSDIQ